MKTMFFVVAALALAPVALAAPPAAPVVTVGANSIKQLQFDWPAVPQANTYELWFRATPGAQWVKYTETIAQRPLIRISVSVHLLDWRVARYRVAACNPSGCRNSAEVGVSDLALDTVGYLKPNTAGEGRWFGQAVAMSADGRTAAVAFSESLGSNADNGIFYVYRKASSTAAWRFEARVKPSLVRQQSSQAFGNALSVNGDGTLIAYGRFFEGIGGQTANGAVYLFRRTGTTWTQEKRLVAGGPAFDYFGNTVDLDDSGNTLAVWRRGTARFSASYGITEIYNHTSAGWQHVTSIPLPASSNGYSPRCDHLALSGDGRKLLRTCYADARPVVLVHDAPGWGESARIYAGEDAEIDTNYDGTLFATRRGYAFADVYRLQQNVWSPDSGSPLDFNTNTNISSPVNTSIAMSRDGKFIAAGDAEDSRGTVGPNYPPIQEDEGGSPGGVFVFQRKPSGWTLRSLMKPSVAARTGFGYSVAIGADGKNLVLGATSDMSAATGINGDPTQSSETSIGAAWLY